MDDKRPVTLEELENLEELLIERSIEPIFKYAEAIKNKLGEEMLAFSVGRGDTSAEQDLYRYKCRYDGAAHLIRELRKEMESVRQNVNKRRSHE